MLCDMLVARLRNNYKSAINSLDYRFENKYILHNNADILIISFIIFSFPFFLALNQNRLSERYLVLNYLSINCHFTLQLYKRTIIT